ncbi:MAG TPA: DUF4139 domain-containing protein, partial [Candidatus Binatia bacterium]|nr:DUF4139 domain-containing protein [Candidatus Binatia bacterium]
MQTDVRRFPRSLACTIALCLSFVSGARARDAEAADSVGLTIYSTARPGAIPPSLYRPVPEGDQHHRGYQEAVPGYAVVKQERQMELPEAKSVVRFTDVAALLDPTTVTFESMTDAATRVIDQSYQFDLVSTAKLMERYLGRDITVEQLQGDHVATISGTLLSTSGGLVLQDVEGRVQSVSGYSNVRFPELPGGLITRPTLVWEVAANRTGSHQVRVTYQTSGITWWADYNVVFTEGKDANSGVLDVGAWVSILNRSGATYADARLKLIAGDVHRSEPAADVLAVQRREVAAMAAPPVAGFEEKSFFEYHLYTLGRSTTIPDRSTKQIELFATARGVPAERVLVYDGMEPQWRIAQRMPMTDREYGTGASKKVATYLRFRNDEASGMGMPLPSGRIRVSKLDVADKTLEFIGEDTIDHTPRNEQVLIKMGNAFDVVGERRQVNFRIDTDDDWMEEDVEVKLRNHKQESVKVLVRETLYRWTNWTIQSESHDY